MAFFLHRHAGRNPRREIHPVGVRQLAAHRNRRLITFKEKHPNLQDATIIVSLNGKGVRLTITLQIKKEYSIKITSKICRFVGHFLF